jgi:hypothetical protein
MDGQEGQYQYSESYSLHLLLDFLALFMKACHPTLTSEQDGMLPLVIFLGARRPTLTSEQGGTPFLPFKQPFFRMTPPSHNSLTPAYRSRPWRAYHLRGV